MVEQTMKLNDVMHQLQSKKFEKILGYSSRSFVRIWCDSRSLADSGNHLSDNWP